MVKLVGYRRFTSKKNVETCIASVIMDANDRDKNSGHVGQKTDEIFMPSDQVDFLKPEHIGKELVLSYDMSGGRAFLTNVAVK